jgi:hypothetical protein
LKGKYEAVYRLRDTSGWKHKWDDEKGVGMTKNSSPEEKAAWAALVKVSISV